MPDSNEFDRKAIWIIAGSVGGAVQKMITSRFFVMFFLGGNPNLCSAARTTRYRGSQIYIDIMLRGDVCVVRCKHSVHAATAASLVLFFWFLMLWVL